MTMSLADLNQLSRAEAAEQLRACCGSSRWVEAMIAQRPFADIEALLTAADRTWRENEPADWYEAFAQHPRIGERQAAAQLGAMARGWSVREQAAAAQSDAATRAALAEANSAYERRFDRVYIVCATGRSAEELLADLEQRMKNDSEGELVIAAEEQRKITRLRLSKLLGAEHT